jgi:hypothetical protein
VNSSFVIRFFVGDRFRVMGKTNLLHRLHDRDYSVEHSG